MSRHYNSNKMAEGVKKQINTEDIQRCMSAGVPIVKEQAIRVNKKDTPQVCAQKYLPKPDIHGEEHLKNFGKQSYLPVNPAPIILNSNKLSKRIHESLIFEFWIADYGDRLLIGTAPAIDGFHIEDRNHCQLEDRSLFLNTPSTAEATIYNLELFFTEFDETMFPDLYDTQELNGIDLNNYREFDKLKALTKRSYNKVRQAFLSGEIIINNIPFPTNIPNSEFINGNDKKTRDIEINLAKGSQTQVILQIPTTSVSPNGMDYRLNHISNEFLWKRFYFMWTGSGVIRYGLITDLGILSNNYNKLKEELQPQTLPDSQPMLLDTKEMVIKEELDSSQPISKDLPMWDKSREDTKAMAASELIAEYETERIKSEGINIYNKKFNVKMFVLNIITLVIILSIVLFYFLLK